MNINRETLALISPQERACLINQRLFRLRKDMILGDVYQDLGDAVDEMRRLLELQADALAAIDASAYENACQNFRERLREAAKEVGK